MSDDDNVIHSYTSDEAIEDGVLCHPYPDEWPWLLITSSIHEACDSAADGRTYDQALRPLLVDCILIARERAASGDFPAELTGTVAGTVWVCPNERGGITVMKPEDY
jgi:hypothetical protein